MRKMDGRILLIIVVAVIVLVLVIVYSVGNGFLDRVNDKIDELTGQSDPISPRVRQSLEPLVFMARKTPPEEYSYRFLVEGSTLHRTVLVTAPTGSRVTLGNELLTDILQEVGGRTTFVGYLFPDENPIGLEVFTRKQAYPLIHLTVPPGSSVQEALK